MLKTAKMGLFKCELPPEGENKYFFKKIKKHLGPFSSYITYPKMNQIGQGTLEIRLRSGQTDTHTHTNTRTKNIPRAKIFQDKTLRFSRSLRLLARSA